jgi:quercetin dioxygenase-like cupin family protein
MMGRRVFGIGVALLALAPAAAQGGNERPMAINKADKALAWGGCPPIYTGECALAVLQGDPAKPNADVFLKVGGGTVLHNHTHSSAERMILVSGQLRVAYAGAGPATLAPGDYAYGPAGAPHEAICLSREPCVLFIAFETAVDAALVK